MAHSLGFYGDGISFWVVFSQSFWLRVLPGGACLVLPRWMPERILGGGQTCDVSFWPFLNSSGWWWLVSFVFLTRTSCHKTTHANGYYGAWPGSSVSVSVLRLIALVVKNPSANAGDIRDVGLIPGLGRSPWGGHGNPLQYSCLENSINRGAWQATVHRVTERHDGSDLACTHTGE